MLFGIGISLGTALLQTKGAPWLADIVVAQFGLKQATAMFILGVISLFLIVIHLRICQRYCARLGNDPIIIAVCKASVRPASISLA